MERINQFAFYELAKALQPLRTRKGDVPPVAAIMELVGAQSEIKLLLDGKPMPLGVSRASAHALAADIDDVLNAFCFKMDAAGKPRFPETTDAPIPTWRWQYLLKHLETFETVFSEEMREATTYFVPRRGIFHTPALVDAADQSFPLDIRGHIPSKSIDDWRSAGRCLAFNLLSASGFHVARAVEGTIEAYYQLFTNKPGKTLKSWNDYLKELEAIHSQSPSPEPRTLAEIRQMKDDFRNPLMHPRVVLSESDARMLFNNGESLIIAMAQEIKLASTGAQLALIPQQNEPPSAPPPQKKVSKQAGSGP